MKKIISIMLVCMLITTISFAGTFTKSSNGSSISINVDQGKTILLKAREIFGKIFTGWTITGATVADASLSEQTITMGSENITATANYATPYTITVEQNANGVISPGTVTVAEGSSKTFTITPNTGHEIEDVKVDGVSVLSSCVAGTGETKIYTMSGINGNHTITATYSSTSSSSGSSLIIPTLTVSSVTTTSITVATSAVDPDGGSLVYKLYANGTLKATSSPTTSSTAVSLTASELKSASLYSITVECIKNDHCVGISMPWSGSTTCTGTGGTDCVWVKAGTGYFCPECLIVNDSNMCRGGCGYYLASRQLFACSSHCSKVLGYSSSGSSSTVPATIIPHCKHGITTVHEISL